MASKREGAGAYSEKNSPEKKKKQVKVWVDGW